MFRGVLRFLHISLITYKKKTVVRIFLKAANQTKKAALKGTLVHQTLFPLIGVKAIITTHDIEE